jgi:predicted phage baseplate assembly protein
LGWVGINAARVTQAVPVVNELLGAGTGEPDQAVTLANRPVIDASVNLQVQDDSGAWETWRLADDLLSAGPDDPAFALDPESGVVRFGGADGGRRPPAGRRIRASYEYGGGTQGNVGVGTIKSSPDVRLQAGFKIDNPVPTWGGTAGESLAQAERNVPLYLRHRDRLVTAQDFRDVTARAPGVDVGRVEVLPLYRPPTAEMPDPPDPAAGVVTVLVVPATDPARPLWPSPDRLFLLKVCEHLGPRRLVTTELYVRGPAYVPVYLSVGIRVQAGNARDVVIDRVTRTLNQYLSSLPPGGASGNGWPLNKKLLRKELEAVVDRAQGVDFVEALQMGVGDAADRDEYPLADLQLPLLAKVSVVEGQPVPLAEVVGPTGLAVPPVKSVAVPVVKGKC